MNINIDTEFTVDDLGILASLIRRRFGAGGIPAWKRLFQNDGWDDAEGVDDWHRMADLGDAYFRAVDPRRK